jgi:serine/threonine protein phosphatase PrpC
LKSCEKIVKSELVRSNDLTKLACFSVQRVEQLNIDGSGTLCLMSMSKQNNIINLFNIGDSGFRLIRNGSIKYKSKATMAGSSPKQLQVTCSHLFNGHSFISEDEIAMDSDLQQFEANINDIIILSSDGMFDVMTDDQIVKVVNENKDQKLQTIANELLMKTMKCKFLISIFMFYF